jgi:gelsolin
MIHVDLHGAPIQYREVQGSESTRFLSYFPRFTCLHGGTASGFHHVTSPPPPDVRKLYRISGDTSRLVVREVPPEGVSLVKGDTYVLDRGTIVWQLNTMGSSGKEKFKAAEVVHELADVRKGACNVEVFGKLHSPITFSAYLY